MIHSRDPWNPFYYENFSQMQMDIPVEEVVVNDGIVEQSAVQSETVQNEEYELTRMPNETEQLPPKQEQDDRDDETIDEGEIPPLENGGPMETNHEKP